MLHAVFDTIRTNPRGEANHERYIHCKSSGLNRACPQYRNEHVDEEGGGQGEKVAEAPNLGASSSPSLATCALS